MTTKIRSSNQLYIDADLDINGKKIVDLANGVANTDAATVGQLNAAVNALLGSADAMVFKGVIDCAASPNYPAADSGWTYKVSVAGKIGGAAGPVVEVGDMIMCSVDASASGLHATVGANWSIVQTNIDGAVTGPASATADAIALFNATTGKVIKDSAKTIVTALGATDATLPTSKAVKDVTDTLLVKNTTITGATKTKITYDAKGLVTAGADATTADIADSTNKRYVTDAHLVILGNTSGVNSGNETAATVATIVNATTAKTQPADGAGAATATILGDADLVPVMNSASANALQKATWGTVKNYLKLYFNTLYNLYVHPNHSGDVTSVADGATTIGANVVTNAKMAQMAANTIKGNNTGATANATDLTIAQLQAMLALKADAYTQRKFRQIPSGLVNGTNAAYTITDLVLNGSEEVFLNGLLQNAGAGNDYTIAYGATTTITFTSAPSATPFADVILVNYSI